MFPTANTLNGGVLIAISKLGSHTWMIGLANQSSLNFSDFGLKLLVKHIGRNRALYADLYVFDAASCSQVWASVAGQM